MNSYRYIRAIFFCIFAATMLYSCASKENITPENEGGEMVVNFVPTISNGIDTRAISDAGSINELLVAVYEVNGNALSYKYTDKYVWENIPSSGISLRFIKGREYKILFWAHHTNSNSTDAQTTGSNDAYSIDEDGNITVNYSSFTSGGFAKMEELDAFYSVKTITVQGSAAASETIQLSRPLSQLNFADNITEPIEGTHKAVLTLGGVATSFNPFTGEVGVDESNRTFTFEFSDFNSLKNTESLSETLSANGGTYYYVATNYLFAPKSGNANYPNGLGISAKLELKSADGATTINSIEFVGENMIKLEQNKKTNVLGAIVKEPEEPVSTWDGSSLTVPTTETVDGQNRYIIDEASDVAWLSEGENASTLEANKTFVVTKDIDMAGKARSSMRFPSGSKIVGEAADNEVRTIKNMTLGGALFGDAKNIEVENLNFESITVEAAAGVTHVGVLVNTLKGSSKFTNVTVSNSSVSTANGAAGGIVGYVVREGGNVLKETESIRVEFKNCEVASTTVIGGVIWAMRAILLA